MISQNWFRWWLGAVRQQAITWANVVLDPCRHMTSIGYNELRESTLSWHWDNRVTPSPWAELRHLCLSGDQTRYSCKTLSWMLRRICGGMSASASTWECSFVGLRGLIVSVTPPLHWQPFLQNVPRHERDKKACASLICTITVGLLRWCLLTCYHVTGST